MKKGYTTGSCAAGATKAALTALLNGKFEKSVSLVTPNGTDLNLKILDAKLEKHQGICAIEKYSGDDPDVTNGALVYGKVRLIKQEEYEKLKEKKSTVDLGDNILLTGGIGIGHITKPGLACKVGEPAINPTPRQMIKNEVIKLKDAKGYDGYMTIEISIPKGVELAQKTFNPKLGITGGISVLGTTGIVEPMSEQALVDTIKVEMSVCKASGSPLVVITPGNYGKVFLKSSTEIKENITVKCSNFIGDALDFAEEMAFEKVILSGHMGKLVKVAGGIINTHSKYGDRRMEIMAIHGKKMGASDQCLDEIKECVMVDEAIRIYEEFGIKEKVMQSILHSIEDQVKSKIKRAEVGVIVFSNKYGILAQSSHIDRLLNEECK